MTTPEHDEQTATPPPDADEEVAAGETVTHEGDAHRPEPDAAQAGAETEDEDLAGLSREELVDALGEARRERDEYLDGLRRSQAEFQNFRRRTMRDGSAQRESGVVEVLGRVVDVVDDFELAILAADSAEPEALRKGVEMVYGKLVDVLRSFGLEKVGQAGAPFDPELHDAVQQVDAEGDEPEEGPVIAEVLRAGYTVGDRVLRPAMVKVRR